MFHQFSFCYFSCFFTRHTKSFALLFMVFLAASVQGQEKDVNGWRNSADEGTTQDTNVSFTLRMTLAGEDTPRASATVGQTVSITTIIRPELADVGTGADVMIVDYVPENSPPLTMRNTDGNFVSWNGSLKTLIPYLEGVTLEEELEVEVFSGQLGLTGNHRIFVGFLVDEVLYFTPSALRFDIEEETVSAREQAIELFNSTISPNIVQARCIQCHVSGGQADGQALHIFVRTTNSSHLSINFGEFENLHTARGSSFILSKVQGMLAHGGGFQLSSGSADFADLSDFLDLLDQAEEESAQALTNDPISQQLAVQGEENDPYGSY